MLYQILDLKKKQESQVQLVKEKQKSDDAAKRLQAEIQSIKAQKVSSPFCDLVLDQVLGNELHDILYFLDVSCLFVLHYAGSVAA